MTGMFFIGQQHLSSIIWERSAQNLNWKQISGFIEEAEAAAK